MRLDAGACNTVLHNTAEIIRLMTVYERVMHAYIRQPAAQDQRLRFQPFQQDFQISAEERRIASLFDYIITSLYFFETSKCLKSTES